MGVQIKASFKKGTKMYNGLDAIEKELLDEPLREHIVIAKVRASKTEIDHLNGGTQTPQVEFHHIEVMLSDKEESAARGLFEAACKARLGEVPQATLFEAVGDGTPADGE